MSAVREGAVVSTDGTPIGYRTTGTGQGLVVLGGSLRAAEDYLPLVTALAGSFTVHLVDRRGRGDSGPLGEGYGLAKEVDDLRAVQADTGARLAFGHSFGGLVLLEGERTSPLFDRIAVYEPGVPARPVPTGWMDPYRERLAADDPYGAFAHFVKGSEGAPAAFRKLPIWYLKHALRVGLRGAAWQRMRPLLGANLAEHQQVAAQAGRLAGFAAVTEPVLLLCGSRTAAAPDGAGPFDALRDTLPNATLETLNGMGHFGPEGKTAPVVAERVAAFFRRPAVTDS
jgi:pimeloyl-ACP methyl ester carboxylesterase